MDFLLLFAIVFANARTAGRKGKSPWGWGILTLVCFFITAMIGGVFLLLQYKGAWTPEAIRAYGESIQGDFVKGLTLSMFGLGGGLFVHYLLSRYPGIPSNSQES